LVCEHSHIRLKPGSKTDYFCVDCGKSFTLSTAGLERFITYIAKAGVERERSFYELRLNEEQKEWLLRLLRAKVRGCNYYIRVKKDIFNSFTPEKREKIRKSLRIAQEIIAKLSSLS